MKKSFVIIFLLASFLMIASCKNVKDALSGAKKNSSDDEVLCTVFVGEDKKWNKIQQQKHPIRWKLNLIDKSKQINKKVIQLKIDFSLKKSFKLFET